MLAHINRTIALASLLAAVAPRPRSLGDAPRHARAALGLEGFSRRADVEFRHLLDTLPTPAYTCDSEGLITYFNKRAVELWGREPRLRDPGDRWCGSFKLFSGDGSPIPHSECWMALAIRNDRAYDGVEIVVEREDGSRSTGLAHANPIHDETGKVIGAVNVLIDISDRKRVETILREGDRSKNEFIAVLAHELRNPLAPMQNALQAMALGAGDEARVEHGRGVLERQLVQLTRIVDDLLDLSRITHNTLELRLAEVELASVLHQAVETSRPLIEAARHDLRLSLPETPIYLEADAVRLAQLFSNLLSNAAKYTEPGGRIWLRAERQGSDAVVAVRDTGIGIAPEAAGQIFQMFNRADGSMERSQGGLGIGLTLARRVAEMHGGSISVTSAGIGLGSEFSVRLPVSIDRSGRRQSRLPRHVADHAPNALRSRLRVLVVDDNPDSAESLADLMRLDGHEAHAAHDGPSALEAASHLVPDVIVLDIGLPRLNGYDVARAIRAQPWGASVLLVAMTGWGQAEDRLRSHEAGFDHHLVKPVAYDDIVNVLAGTQQPPAPTNGELKG